MLILTQGETPDLLDRYANRESEERFQQRMQCAAESTGAMVRSILMLRDSSIIAAKVMAQYRLQLAKRGIKPRKRKIIQRVR